MRRLLVLVASGAAAFFVGAVPAHADNGPHVSTAYNCDPTTQTCGVTGFSVNAGGAKCAACHRAHTAQGSYLLVAEQPALCFTCHDGTGATTNVVNGYQVGVTGPNGGLAALRGGGFTTALIGTGAATKSMLSLSPYGWHASNQMIPTLASGAPVTSTHSVDETVSSTAWGNGPISATANTGSTIQLTCGSCHDPHGNGNYRILKPIPNQSGATTGVVIADTTTKVYNTTNYWIAGDLNDTSKTSTTADGQTLATPASSFIANVSVWCSQCHTRYIAGSGSYKTNSGDAIFTYRHRSGAVPGDGTEQGRPNCIQCHVAHGSNASMTGWAAKVAFPGTTVASADSRLLRVDNRGICVLCHNA